MDRRHSSLLLDCSHFVHFNKVESHASYLVPVWDHLARHAMATLTFDKPGLGGSSGDWRQQTFYDRVEQARAVITVNLHDKWRGFLQDKWRT